jgi:hypothetical protein
MQPCIRIYYSTVHWRLNMFRAAHHSSSGALTVFAASGLHTDVVTGHSQVWVGTTMHWFMNINEGKTCAVYAKVSNDWIFISSPPRAFMTWTVISLLGEACRITVHFSLNYFKGFEGYLVRTSCYQKPRKLRGLHYSFRKAQRPNRPRAVLVQPNRRFSPCLTFKNRAPYI